MTRPGIFGVTVQIWRKEGEHPMSDGNRNAGREALPAGPERPSITLPAELAVHLGRESSASAVDDNGWTDPHYAAALDWPAWPGCCQDRFSRCLRTGATPLHIAAPRATHHLHWAASRDAVAAVEVLLSPRGKHPYASGRRQQAVGCRGGQARLEGGARCCSRAAPVRGRRTTTAAPPPSWIQVRKRCIDTRAADDEWSVAHRSRNSGR